MATGQQQMGQVAQQHREAAKHHQMAADHCERAAKAFEAGLARSPYSRDGLYNSLSTYYLLGDTAKIVPTARRLVAVDPMNRSALKLAAAAHQMAGKVDSTVYYVTQADSVIPLDVTVQSFRITDQGASFAAIATPLSAKISCSDSAV